MASARWSVYMLYCGDGSLYTGVTTDVESRLRVHNNGKGGAYTRSHRPVRLLYQENGYSRRQALRREAEIKRLSRPEKEKFLLSVAPGS